MVRYDINIIRHHFFIQVKLLICFGNVLSAPINIVELIGCCVYRNSIQLAPSDIELIYNMYVLLCLCYIIANHVLLYVCYGTANHKHDIKKQCTLNGFRW